ncbi:MAG TPA: lytic transglycosylase domain-containing protein [Solirubrobacteraceae bacterium]|nr:lytic transglycosylase domain-containing protein [Solirubrobacteraceae bacterium]
MSQAKAPKGSLRLVLRHGSLTAVLTGAGAVFAPAALATQAPTVTGPGNPPETSTPSEAPVSTTPSTSTTQTATTPTTTATSPTTSTTTGTSTQTTTATSTTPTKSPRAHKGPKAVVQHSQGTTTTPTQTTPAVSAAPTVKAPATPNSSTAIAPAPQLAAVQSGALAAMMNGSAASLQALSFYRIPLFLLPIYQAAAVQYGLPWQVLAAINEVETNFGTDLSVSSAGAVGWMQFMPETWLQYGVDALGAGYADPYNPVDAIFAAARYLHAAGASSNLRGAILAYNHSEAYAESVLLRARLFASYPTSAIATLTGLSEGSLPVADARLAPGSPIPTAQAPAPAVAPAAAVTPGTNPAPSPQESAKAAGAASSSQLSELFGKKRAPVLAVEDGRIVGIGVSRKIGEYMILRDTYGDLFTYGGLGSLAPAYRVSKPAPLQLPKGALPSGESTSTPTQAATAGSQSPLTLHVAARKPAGGAGASTTTGQGSAVQAPAAGKVRVFAHPGNPDAVAAKRLREQEAQNKALAAGWAVLQRGSLVSQGTVLGHLSGGGEGSHANLRFSIRPAGAQSPVDPRPILENWRQLSSALHPRGSKAGAVLAGATAADAFQLSAGDLERAVLADPGIQMGACDRSQVATGKVDPHALALLVFLSRSGLKPTVGELRCGVAVNTAAGVQTVFPAAGTLDIAAINGVPISGHQGAGTITDVTIRTLLTIKHHYAPKRIVSLMSYPGAPSTVAEGNRSTFIQLEVPTASVARSQAVPTGAKSASATARSSKATHPGSLSLDTFEWQRLIDQIASIEQPKVTFAPSASAIRDATAPGSGSSTRTLP